MLQVIQVIVSESFRERSAQVLVDNQSIEQRTQCTKSGVGRKVKNLNHSLHEWIVGNVHLRDFCGIGLKVFLDLIFEIWTVLEHHVWVVLYHYVLMSFWECKILFLNVSLVVEWR